MYQKSALEIEIYTQIYIIHIVLIIGIVLEELLNGSMLFKMILSVDSLKYITLNLKKPLNIKETYVLPVKLLEMEVGEPQSMNIYL